MPTAPAAKDVGARSDKPATIDIAGAAKDADGKNVEPANIDFDKEPERAEKNTKHTLMKHMAAIFRKLRLPLLHGVACTLCNENIILLANATAKYREAKLAFLS